MQIHIRQYRTDNSSLERSFYRFETCPSSATTPALSHFLISRLIVPSPYSDVQHLHLPVMVEMVIEPFDIRFHYVAVFSL